jgi:hypothetical protein
MLTVLLVVLISGCTTLTTINGICGSSPRNDVCMGDQSIPEGQEELFRTASTEVVDAIGSVQFLSDLERFESLFALEVALSKAWSNVKIEQVQSSLLNEIRGLEIETYGGVKGLFLKLVYGNVAYDGSSDGPIRLNRWALPRSSASIANTIAHEAAHRIEFQHPNSDNDLKIANCEPPYVIGSLVEKAIEPTKWNSMNHCFLFSSDEWNEI